MRRSCSHLLCLPADARREQRFDIALEAKLSCGRCEKATVLDALFGRQMVLLLELIPREMKQAEKRFENALAADGACLEHRLASPLRQLIELFVGADVRQVAFVELNDKR